jgi:hypothetical protein
VDDAMMTVMIMLPMLMMLLVPLRHNNPSSITTHQLLSIIDAYF